VICDIERAERDFLDPDEAPGLLQAGILVKSHECNHAVLMETVQQRSVPAHVVERCHCAVNSLSDLDRLIALWEWRVGPTP